MLPIFSRIKAWWDAADKNQRVVTLGGIGALLLLLGGTAFFATRPQYETMAEGLSELEQAQDVAALATAGITAQPGEGGTLKVPKGQKNEARMKLALAGKLPKGEAHLTFADLKNIGPMASPEVESETVKAILQGEIAGAVETMDGVAGATVLITKPKQSVFAQDQTHPTASVTITENGKGILSAQNGRTIASLVCASVDGMSPEDVFVSSTSGGVLWDGHNTETGGTKADLDAKVARYWEEKVQASLAAMGADNFRVAVRADVDTSRRHVRNHDVTPTERPTASESKKETMEGGARKTGGAAGSVANMGGQGGAPATAVDSGKGAYSATEKRSEFATSTKEEEIEGGGGDLRGLSISVLANSDKITNPSDVQKALDGLMGGLIQRDTAGLPLPNQAFSATVSSMKFDVTAEVAAKAAADAAASGQRTQQLLSYLPIAAVLLVALLVAKQVGKISKAVLPAAPAEIAMELPAGPDGLPAHEAMGALPMYAGEPEPEPSFVLEPIKDRVDLPLEGLKQIATERPEMMATLIKSMMLGERA